CLFLGILVFALYGNSIRNGYSLDDDLVVYQNTQVHEGIKGIPNIFTTRYSKKNDESYGYRPIVKSSFAIEYSLFGENPHISHFINVLIYAFTCIFLFLFLQKLLANYSIILPLLITTIFLVHPIHTEVVDSLKNRDALFSFLGSIVAAYFFIKYATQNKIKYVFLGAFAFIFAMLSKIDAMTFLVIIPLFVYFFSDLNLKKMFFCFGIVLLSLLLFIALQKCLLSGNQVNRPVHYVENPLYFIHAHWVRIKAGLVTFLWYIQLFIFPKNLICYYGYDQINILHPAILTLLISIIILITFLTVAFWGFRKRKLISFGIFFFFISISMFLNYLVPAVGIVAERFAYIPSLGLCIIAAILILEIFRIPYKSKEINLVKINRYFYFFISMILVLFSGRTIARNFDWKDQYTLYAHDIVYAEKSVHLQQLLATQYLNNYFSAKNITGQTKTQLKKDIVTCCQNALKIYPDDETSLNNLGMANMIFDKNYNSALPLFRKAVQIDSEYVQAYFNMASCEKFLGNDSLSEKYFLKTIDLKPSFMSAYKGLTNLYLSHDFYDDAFALNYGAIEKGFKTATVYEDLGTIYLSKGDSLRTAEYFEIAFGKDSTNKNYCAFLANYYLKKGDKIKYEKYKNLSTQGNSNSE
ncbi:MAG TPA: hypothetical protein VIJ57_00910, partial [Hanamia sp.]